MSLISSDVALNEAEYEINGPLYVGTQMLWNMFFDYASYTSAIAWMGIFGYPFVKASIKRWTERSRDYKRATVNHQYHDQLNVLMRSYPEVPAGWYLMLFVASSIIFITLSAKGYLFIPIWTLFIAMVTGAIVVIVSDLFLSRSCAVLTY